MTKHDTTTDPSTQRVIAGRHTGRIAVVTGATSGIGEATALQLAAEGACVALVGRRTDRLEAVASTIRAAGGTALPVTADLAEAGAAATAAEQVRDELGRPDLVVANAGVMLPAPYETPAASDIGRMLDLNIRGLVETGQAFAEDLLAAGADGRPADLVHTGSIGGHMIFPTYAVYCATKAAVAQITRNVRAEWGPRGVRVRTVEPGFTATELSDHILDPEAQNVIVERRERIGTISAADLADVIVYTTGLPAGVNVTELVVVPTGQ